MSIAAEGEGPGPCAGALVDVAFLAADLAAFCRGSRLASKSSIALLMICANDGDHGKIER